MRLLRELHADGRSIVMVTHSPEIAEKAERVVEIRDGVAIDSVEGYSKKAIA